MPLKFSQSTEIGLIARIVVISIFSITAMSCESPYYGYSKSEWEKLSAEEQITIKTEYEDILASKNDQKHKELIDSYKQQIIDRGVQGPGYHHLSINESP